MSAPTPFTFSNAYTVRVIDVDGIPWFVAADVCSALGLGDTSKTISRLDDDERGTNTVRTPSGDQQMLIINESGLYSLILTSRKPEAKTFKKWVTAEVLPAIRKTGKYEAPPPGTAPECLSHADMNNLTRLVWLISRNTRNETAWAQAVWKSLRQATGTPSPQRFQVQHIPLLAAEVRRIYTITEQYRAAVFEAEKIVTGRIFRKGEDADKVMAEVRRSLSEAANKEAAALKAVFNRWSEQDIAHFAQRGIDNPGHYPEMAEMAG